MQVCPKCGYADYEDCDCVHMLGRRENKEQICHMGRNDSTCPWTSLGGLRGCKEYKSKYERIKE